MASSVRLCSSRIVRTAFDDQDLALVTLFGQQATIVLERAVLHEQLMRQSRLDRDMDIARDILKSLSPESAPTFTGMDVFGRSVTAETVGGDAFDFIPYPESQLGISISDAKGKGLPAALLAVAHHAMVHALVSVELRLRITFSRVSDLLARSLPPGNFITTFYGIIDITERRVIYVNAGHPPPLLVRANGHTEVLPSTGPTARISTVLSHPGGLRDVRCWRRTCPVHRRDHRGRTFTRRIL